MLNATLAFLVIAIIAGVLGFTSLEGTASSIAKVLFLGFLLISMISFLAGRRVRA